MERPSRAGENVSSGPGGKAVNTMETYESIKIHRIFYKFNNEVIIFTKANKKLSKKVGGVGTRGILLVSYLALQ